MLGTDVNDDIANLIAPSCSTSRARTTTRTSGCTSTRPAARSPPAWPSTTPCSSSAATSPRSAWAWPPRWASSCSCAGAKGKRYALPHARIMMHQPSGGLRGQAADIAIQAEQMAYTKQLLAERIAHHTGQTVEQITLDSDRDRWFTRRGGQGLRHHRPRHREAGRDHLTRGRRRWLAPSVGVSVPGPSWPVGASWPWPSAGRRRHGRGRRRTSPVPRPRRSAPIRGLVGGCGQAGLGLGIARRRWPRQPRRGRSAWRQSDSIASGAVRSRAWNWSTTLSTVDRARTPAVMAG